MPQKTPALIELTTVGRPCFPPREQEKKHRRMIANSNERRRMQSINAGFQQLKNLVIPRDGEKLSKASVLQQAVEHIRRLEMEKTYLLAENKRLERLAFSHNHITTGTSYHTDGPATKRRKADTESSDEGVSMATDESLAVDDLRRQLDELRQRLECERQTRALLERQQQLHLMTESYANKPTDSFPDIGIRYSMSAPSENVGLCGSLETIVEAIQHLEGAQTAQNSPVHTKSDSFTSEDDVDHDDSNSAHSAMFLSSSSLQLPATELMRVVAAAEALQCFAKKHEATGRTSQSFPCLLQPIRSSVGSKLHQRLLHSQQGFHNS